MRLLSDAIQDVTPQIPDGVPQPKPKAKPRVANTKHGRAEVFPFYVKSTFYSQHIVRDSVVYQ